MLGVHTAHVSMTLSPKPRRDARPTTFLNMHSMEVRLVHTAPETSSALPLVAVSQPTVSVTGQTMVPVTKRISLDRF